MGDYALTRLLQSLKFAHIFHLYGGKYAVLCMDDEAKDRVINTVSRKREGVICYYSVSEIDKDKAFDPQLSAAYDLMNEQKSERMLDALSQGIAAQTIPAEFAETENKKYNNTLIYNDYLVCPKGQFNDTKVIVYPLEFKRDEKSNILVVVSSETKQRAFTGLEIQFGITGTLYNANARFSREGELDVFLFATNNESEITKHQVKGCGIPSNFGKKIDDGELFPYRDAMGKAHFVLVQDGKMIKIYDDYDIIINDNRYHIAWDDIALEVWKA
jgi:hypothetical protein